MNMNVDKEKWQVTDILVALFILILINVLSMIVISPFFKPTILLFHIFDSIFILAPIYYLNNKYPLKIFSKFNKEHLKYLVIGITLCIILNFFSYISARSTRNIPEQYSLLMGYNMYQKGLNLFLSLIVAPLQEEIFFRGFMYRILRNRYDIFWGALGSTIIFSLFHGLNMDIIINIGIFGLICVYVYHKTESIPLTALTHSVGNALWLIAIHYGLKGW
jgi:membrane protease YdiL (CAAX protease family)